MSIHIIAGKPGSGKSYYSMKWLVNELKDGERNIVTNLPVKLAELNEYCQKTYPALNLRATERVQILQDAQLPQFFRYRGNDWAHLVELCKDPKTTAIELQKLHENPNSGNKGVAYFLDEAHLYFNARDWATCSKDVLVYLSQHRKLKDEVYCITQAVAKIDKQFRSDAQSFVMCENWYRRQVMIFKTRGRFVASWYNQEPNSWMDKPYWEDEYHLDPKGIGSTYDTTAGFQMKGNTQGAESNKKKLLPFWAIIAFFVAGIALSILAVKGFQWGWGYLFNPKSLGLKKGRETAQVPPQGSSPGISAVAAPSSLTVLGYYGSAKTFVAYLSDGRVVTSDDKQLTKVTENYIEYNGVKIPLAGFQSSAGTTPATDNQNPFKSPLNAFNSVLQK